MFLRKYFAANFTFNGGVSLRSAWQFNFVQVNYKLRIRSISHFVDIICIFLYLISWNYTKNMNNTYQNSFIKVYRIWYDFEVERNSILTKNRNTFWYQTTNLLKTRSLFFVCKKGEKEDKSKFVTTFVGIIVRLFSSKNVSQIASKTLTTQCFFHKSRTWITKL